MFITHLTPNKSPCTMVALFGGSSSALNLNQCKVDTSMQDYNLKIVKRYMYMLWINLVFSFFPVYGNIL